MTNQNQMSADDYQRYIKANSAGPAKIKTRLVAPKKHADTITAGQYRADHTDKSEHGLQARCVEWFRIQYPNLLLFAVPNAALRSFVLAAKLEDEGLVAGIPDLILAYPYGGKPGLYIEMKTMQRHSKPSDEQLKIQVYLRAVGYEVAMPRTFEEFQNVITDYLDGY